MEIYHLMRGRSPQRLDTLERLPDDGYVWLDFVRDEKEAWEAWPRRLLGLDLDPRHVTDSRDEAHKSFFDVAPGYDFLVFEETAPQDDLFRLDTRSASMFMCERLLVTVHAADSASFRQLKQQFADGITRAPAGVRVLTQILLGAIAVRFSTSGENFNRRLEDLQQSLLDPTSPFKDWRQLLDGRRDAYRMECLCRGQLKSLERWHRHSGFPWDNPEETRLHDISEHLMLLRDASSDLERHIEAAVQIYFASTTYRTNEIVRVLTVFSAIFLPLTFLAGVYGMNFAVMPELSLSFGYPLILVVMVLLAVVLLRYFRRRGYF